jgi:hypothetical protein
VFSALSDRVERASRIDRIFASTQYFSIGFPQNISVGPNVLDPEHFRKRALNLLHFLNGSFGRVFAYSLTGCPETSTRKGPGAYGLIQWKKHSSAPAC